MAAKVIPMYRNRKHRDGQDDWRNRCFAYIGTLLEEFLAGSATTKLSETTGSLFRHKADILGELALALIEKHHRKLNLFREFSMRLCLILGQLWNAIGIENLGTTACWININQNSNSRQGLTTL